MMDEKIVGILSDPAYIRMLQSDKHIPSAEIAAMEAKRLGTPVCFFSYDDMDLEAGDVIAFFKDKELWKKIKVHLPQVIYDHAFSCPMLLRSKLMNIKGIRFVNEKIGFWKWDTHVALSKFPELSPFLPETYLFENDAQLAKMLDAHGRAVLKPVYGQKSMGVILFSCDKGITNYQYRGKGQKRLQYFKGTVEKLENIRDIFDVMGKEKYVVQQGLKLAKYKGRVFDVRALMQKDGNGEWIPSLCAKVGPENSEISAMGEWSSIDAVEEYLTAENKECFRDITTKIKSLALKVSYAIDEAYAPSGEIALDIGVDAAGRIWLLEVNSMPGKSMFHYLLKENELYELYALPIRYASRLASEAGILRQEGD